MEWVGRAAPIEEHSPFVRGNWLSFALVFEPARFCRQSAGSCAILGHCFVRKPTEKEIAGVLLGPWVLETYAPDQPRDAWGQVLGLGRPQLCVRVLHPVLSCVS